MVGIISIIFNFLYKYKTTISLKSIIVWNNNGSIIYIILLISKINYLIKIINTISLKFVNNINLMKVAIITGITGQDGSYLVELLLENK